MSEQDSKVLLVDSNGNLAPSVYSASTLSTLISKLDALSTTVNVLTDKMNAVCNMRLLRMGINVWNGTWNAVVKDDGGATFSSDKWVIGIVGTYYFRNDISFFGVHSYAYVKDGFWWVALAEVNRANNINMAVELIAIPRIMFSNVTPITSQNMTNSANYNM